MSRRRSLRWNRVAALAVALAAVALINWVSDRSLWRLYEALFSYAMWGS